MKQCEGTVTKNTKEVDKTSLFPVPLPTCCSILVIQNHFFLILKTLRIARRSDWRRK